MTPATWSPSAISTRGSPSRRLTPYHAIRAAHHKLYAGSTAVVIGAGGLGHVGIQILRAISSARVIAMDLNEDKLALAAEVGAHETLTSGPDTAAKIRELTCGLGAEAVFDFVGAQPTLDMSREAVARWSSSNGIGTLRRPGHRTAATRRASRRG